MTTAIEVLAGWFGLSLIAAPLVGRLLARRGRDYPAPDELLAWHRALRDDEATDAFAATPCAELSLERLQADIDEWERS